MVIVAPWNSAIPSRAEVHFGSAKATQASSDTLLLAETSFY
jgi:hypothetical protein